jgi:hypothetical protein
MTRLDGFGTARTMIALYGKDAQGEARRRSESALKRKDMPGFERWTHIASMIGIRQSRGPVPPLPAIH